nr:MAG TPA: hypothetical protein [Caudoviricetes sp.]
MDSLTSFNMSMAFCISSVSPMAMVAGLCTIIMATGLMQTFVPAIAMTDAAEAARASILTVTSCG